MTVADTAPSTAPAATRLAFIGDLMLARKVSAQLSAGRAPEAFWGDVRPHCLAADAVIGNLECPITSTTRRWNRWKAFRFCADPRAVEILAAGNVRCVALANNHALDCTEEGLADTRRHLAAAGIAHAGAGRDMVEAREPALFRAGPVSVGFASVTNTMRSFAAGPTHAGTCYLPIRTDAATLTLIGSLAASLRRSGAEVLVLSVHWGPNLRPWPPRRYRKFARRAIELGFDIVHGHSAHILQALEFHAGGIILYDTGEFIDDYWVFPGIRTDRSFLFVVEFRAGFAPTLKLVPVTITPGLVSLANGEEAAAIRHAMRRRCRRFAVELIDDGNILIARPRSRLAGFGAGGRRNASGD